MNVNPYHGTDPSLERKLASLHEEMQSLRMECDSLINKHLLVENNLYQVRFDTFSNGAICRRSTARSQPGDEQTRLVRLKLSITLTHGVFTGYFSEKPHIYQSGHLQCL